MITSHRQYLDSQYRILDGLARNERHRKEWRAVWAEKAAEVKRQRDQLTDAMHKKAGDDLAAHVKEGKR